MQKQNTVMTGMSEGLLLIEGDFTDATQVLNALTGRGQPHVEWAQSLSEGLQRLKRPGVAAILLNPFLPDSAGIETFDKVMAAAGPIPILVLCNANNEHIGRLAVDHGADDFILKYHFDSYSLPRAVKSMLLHRVKDHELFVAKQRAEVTLNSIGDAVLCTDMSGNVSYLNTVAENMTGWSRAEATGRPLAEVFNIVDGATREPSSDPLALAVRDNKVVSLTPNCILIRRDGLEYSIEDSAAPIHDYRGRVIGAVIVFHDVSAARQISTHLSHLAQHDFLTDLPNRMLLSDRLQQTISLARRHHYRVAVMFLDLDHFKHINDSLGHLIGDQLLQAIANRLKHSVRTSDTVGRHGGDEFVVVLSELAATEDPGRNVAKLLATLAMPYHVGPHELRVPVSIGVSVYPDDAVDADTLINYADTAMYHAKENGRHNYQFFGRELTGRTWERRFIESNLRGAIERDEFSLYYQPKIDFQTGAITGVEALLRWCHPERGLIPPMQFVPIAEDTGLIVPIGQWVLAEACRQSRAWLDSGLPCGSMAVNISAVEFRSQGFIEGIRATLKETQLDPEHLDLELTESVLMKHPESTASTLESLKRLGVQLTVDDFGTGYSSLSYLRQFPIDSLKVDQSFVHEISTMSDDARIVSAVIRMGNSLRKRVIAEGVETREQLDFLTSEGCSQGQGYYFHRPMMGDQVTALLAAAPRSNGSRPYESLRF